MSDRKLFLICNDDGVHADGLDVLARACAEIGEVYVVAPSMERSATSHSITIHDPIRLLKMPDRSYSSHIYSTNGSPADCALIGLDKVMPRKPDFLISGINRGSNLGVDTLYSGTIGAAMQGCLHGVPSIAISAYGMYRDHFQYEAAAQVFMKIFDAGESLLPQEGSLLNINVPSLPYSSLKGIRGATLGRLLHDNTFQESFDPHGRPYYWLGPPSRDYVDDPGSDCNLVAEGYATVSVLRPSLLHEAENSAYASRINLSLN